MISYSSLDVLADELISCYLFLFELLSYFVTFTMQFIAFLIDYSDELGRMAFLLVFFILSLQILELVFFSIVFFHQRLVLLHKFLDLILLLNIFLGYDMSFISYRFTFIVEFLDFISLIYKVL